MSLERYRGRALIAVATLVAVGAIVALGLSASAGAVQETQQNVSEEAYIEPAPESGDAYFEAEASDGSWVSYVNPRDEYRSPYLGDGSAKLCVTLVNERGEPVVGESVPGTTVTLPTGDSTSWHSHADPFVVEYPLTEHYQRPLDSDQFGTDPDLAQGDGYMDSHCLEIHGLPEDGGTVEYGEVEVTGEYAADIEVVGYIQQAHDSWDTDVDPIADAESYDDAGGGWTYYPDGSHGQVVAVLQLDGDADIVPEVPDVSDDDSDDHTNESTNSSETAQNEPESDDDTSADDDSSSSDQHGDDEDESMPGFGVVPVLAALLAVACVRALSAR
ncbi:PGF-CTERM sorting domain-containing protein [Natronolimnobius baerhuensis]|uniref:PGF-CTERM sorting domain-containing protein n=1 Tax=Natronolimnobius baerhuensis TaxID=253108 RepID=A0A202ECH5_9EURY|nr:PGF-CTERM sorting domain-containing protein [Natronolimnobius baerhuensis]OVE85929.1 PGF-CTERM sorting domain-containing protein [Natronolimnobius baerhuensis]